MSEFKEAVVSARQEEADKEIAKIETKNPELEKELKEAATEIAKVDVSDRHQDLVNQRASITTQGLSQQRSAQEVGYFLSHRIGTLDAKLIQAEKKMAKLDMKAIAEVKELKNLLRSAGYISSNNGLLEDLKKGGLHFGELSTNLAPVFAAMGLDLAQRFIIQEEGQGHIEPANFTDYLTEEGDSTFDYSQTIVSVTDPAKPITVDPKLIKMVEYHDGTSGSISIMDPDYTAPTDVIPAAAAAIVVTEAGKWTITVGAAPRYVRLITVKRGRIAPRVSVDMLMKFGMFVTASGVHKVAGMLTSVLSPNLVDWFNKKKAGFLVKERA